MGWFMTVVSGMTAFYMFRLYYVIFWGQSYYETHPENRRKPGGSFRACGVHWYSLHHPCLRLDSIRSLRFSHGQSWISTST